MRKPAHPVDRIGSVKFPGITSGLETTNPSGGTTASASSRRARWLYSALLAMETLGALVLYWQGLPLYRKLSADIAAHVPQASTILWVIAAGTIIQVAYWTGYHARMVPPIFANAVLGHIMLFIARLAFLLPTAIFSFLFLGKALENQLPASRYLVILFGLFSLYCYTRELERFGNRLLQGPNQIELRK
jgi:hypothetical protein